MHDIKRDISAISWELKNATDAVREASLLLLLAMSANGFKLDSNSRPAGKSDVHFQRDGQKPFSFIFNKTDLLFYLRKPAADVELDGEVEVEEGVKGERKVRVRSEAEARQLIASLGLPAPI